ncbi:Histidine kinase-like ATPase domain-containing protein [Glycomyces sambucus]|uniref:Histidine kinase-like ATPase domain-containing protein n=1 Tax=Glycomyces sambucus TaxID=380244 RepID=A0A1G9K5X5_9ACTN|nr:sensor histidine kinase [Glycomyces sambucus]SDL45042.1 Histidine kinase-like ATPase domain-containing protein [Glycomyces sambucus]
MTAAAGPATGDPFRHTAFQYTGDDEYLTGTMAFIEQAFALDAPVVIAVPVEHFELLRKALGGAVDRVRLLNMSEVGANPGRIIPGVLRAFTDVYADRRSWVVGESTWPGRTDTEYPACAQHEALINYAFAGRDVAMLCPHDVAGLGTRAVADLRATHPRLIDPTGEHASAAYDPGRVVSEYNAPFEPPPKFAIERAVDIDTIDNARWFTVAFGRRAGLSGMQLVDLEIAVTELLINSVLHGGGSAELRIWSDERALVCAVSDAGHITDLLAGRRPVDAAQPFGRGLLLVNSVVDLLRTHTSAQGTETRLHLSLLGF